MSINTIKDVNRLLDRIPMFAREGARAARFGLDTMRALCHELGDPQAELRSIHVAGTNGKGITCHMLASVYGACGVRVGLNTSPHLLRFNERMRVDGVDISDAQLVELFREARPAIEKIRPTYFELATALALLWFRKEKVELAIVETGLGGRLDATNILRPECSVITSVGLDHTDLLGNSLTEIAREKAGIIKPGVPVVAGRLPKEAMQVVELRATENNCTLHRADEMQPGWESGRYHLKWEGRCKWLDAPLRAPIQAVNLATSAQVAKALSGKFALNWDCFSRGIEKMQVQQLPGRFEQLHENVDWYFDGAHNAEAVQALLVTVKTIRSPAEAILVLSLMRDKMQPEIMQAFSEFGKIYYYALDSARAASFTEFKKLLPGAEPLPADPEARTDVLRSLKHSLVIYAGSFYFYGTVRKWLSAMDLDE